MALPLPPYCSQAEFNDIYASLSAGGSAAQSTYMLSHTMPYLQPKVQERLVGASEVLPLPSAWSQLEFDDFYAALFQGGQREYINYIITHAPSYLNDNIAERAALPTVTRDFTTGTLPSGVTLTRASIGWAFNSAGSLTSYASNVPRFNYNHLTLALNGLLNEAATTQLNRNSNASGSVVGTPGTLPTFWGYGTMGTLSTAIVAKPVVNGMQCVDVRFFGTTSNASAYLNLFDTNNQSFGAGLNLVESAYIALVDGSIAGLNTLFLQHTYTPSGQTIGVDIKSLLTANLQRFSLVGTSPVGTTGGIGRFSANWFSSGAVLDFTIRYANPQFEVQPAVTSAVVSTAGQITRAADILTVTGLTAGLYNITITRLTGQTVLPAVDCSGGTYVVPNDPSSVRSLSLVPA